MIMSALQSFLLGKLKCTQFYHLIGSGIGVLILLELFCLSWGLFCQSIQGKNKVHRLDVFFSGKLKGMHARVHWLAGEIRFIQCISTTALTTAATEKVVSIKIFHCPQPNLKTNSLKSTANLSDISFIHSPPLNCSLLTPENKLHAKAPTVFLIISPQNLMQALVNPPISIAHGCSVSILHLPGW